jgi:signal transduction histidine kinase
MSSFSSLLARGLAFVRNNPQIIYTLFLVIAIPMAFFFTSEQFLRIARENQDRLERSRVATLSDAVAAFLPEVADPSLVREKLLLLARDNPTLNTFQILTPAATSTTLSSEYRIVTSLRDDEMGHVVTPDDITHALMKLAYADTATTYTMSYRGPDGRHWRSVRALFSPETFSTTFIVTDISMSQADAVSRKSIVNAYFVLIVIALLIIILLARQARIIDYATLYRRLKEVDQMKDDFVSMAAHELRSPLTIIRGYVEMIGEGEGLSEKGKGNLRNIEMAASQLNTLIGDILDVSRLQEGRMSFRMEERDPAEDIATVVDSFIRPAADKGLALSFVRTPLPHILVDVDRFRQVLINLIGNAIKYTPSGSVTVSTNLDGKQVVIRVSDTGMGISAEDQQKLFQKFFRVKNDETKLITGTGLGLWITTSLVKQMGGSIAVESIKGKGSDFVVSFPVASSRNISS